MFKGKMEKEEKIEEKKSKYLQEKNPRKNWKKKNIKVYLRTLRKEFLFLDMQLLIYPYFWTCNCLYTHAVPFVELNCKLKYPTLQ
ncbi:hypothetical protein Y1Q_0003254 [Alligator mississippiensis]|uniref:Uncharacterized protein n=1 Tax=Alligator mississippiensis TaxID=8496 RepID=A0A151ME24_ALLMI|nr:hypothetical protein Y1Q_0003254 [Alligator mississippiensis]